MSNGKIFKPAAADTYSKGITITVFVMLAGFLIIVGLIEDFWWAALIGAGVILFAILIALSLRPVSYMLEGKDLKIKKQFGQTAMIENIKTAEPVRAVGIRTFGVGGLFAYTGWFNGNEEWFVTDRKKAVKLTSEDKTVLISPENPEEFMRNFVKEKK